MSLTKQNLKPFRMFTLLKSISFRENACEKDKLARRSETTSESLQRTDSPLSLWISFTSVKHRTLILDVVFHRECQKNETIPFDDLVDHTLNEIDVGGILSFFDVRDNALSRAQS